MAFESPLVLCLSRDSQQVTKAVVLLCEEMVMGSSRTVEVLGSLVKRSPVVFQTESVSVVLTGRLCFAKGRLLLLLLLVEMECGVWVNDEEYGT